MVLDMVKAEVAAVLGHSGGTAVDADRGLFDIGFDSLTAVELRNRLGAAWDVQLPTTVLFDHPTAGALAAYLRSRIDEPADGDATGAAALLAELARWETELPGFTADEDTRSEVAARLQRLLATVAPPVAVPSRYASAPTGFDEATDDELFAMLDADPASEHDG
jgi:acyl carrier protein